MQIPEYWAEHRLVGDVHERRRVVRRFGWSDESLQRAEQHAQERAEQALAELRAGRAVPGREKKRAYGGDGLPIREQVLARNGQDVVTRNSYGARCLNQPDVLFADIDIEFAPGCVYQLLVYVESALLAAPLWFVFEQACLRFWLAIVLPLWIAIWRIESAERRNRRRRGRYLERVRRSVERAVARRGGMRVALYETPAGVRVLVLDRTFDPTSAEAQTLFRELGADPAYAQMCALQACFRARVSAKPWRIELPRPPTRAVWPVPDARRADRDAWVDAYEARAAGFAACRFVGELGDGEPIARCLRVQHLHDQLSRAQSGLPIA